MKRSVAFVFLAAFTFHLYESPTNSHSLASQQNTQKDASARQDLENLQGVWYHASREEKGKQIVGEAKDVLIAFRENAVVFKKGTEVSQVGVLKNIDATASPKTVDIVITDGSNEGMTIKAIYEIKDELFRYCGPTNEANARRRVARAAGNATPPSAACRPANLITPRAIRTPNLWLRRQVLQLAEKPRKPNRPREGTAFGEKTRARSASHDGSGTGQPRTPNVAPPL